MVRSYHRLALVASLGFALTACGGGVAEPTPVEVTICSKLDSFQTPCGKVNHFLCNSTASAKTVRITRSFVSGTADPRTEIKVTPANANLENQLAPFIGRDEVNNPSSGQCAAVMYTLQLVN